MEVDGDSQDRDTPPDGWSEEYPNPGYSQRQVAALEREVRDLTAEIEQKEAQLQEVIHRYEQLLEEKNRTLAKQDSGTDSELPLSPLRHLLGR
ncbi:MAG: hypothetical protein V5A25_10565 [Halovenus sp.]